MHKLIADFKSFIVRVQAPHPTRRIFIKVLCELFEHPGASITNQDSKGIHRENTGVL